MTSGSLGEAEYDRFGFLSKYKYYPDNQKAAEREKKKESEREMKWLLMIKDWDHLMETKPKLIHTRVKKVIPEAVRSKAWQLLVDPAYATETDRPTIQSLLNARGKEEVRVIEADLPRTFPYIKVFSYEQTVQSLHHILYAYHYYDPEIGYTQGMSFIAAMFLNYMDEASAFWCFVSIMKNPKYNLRECFRVGFPRLHLLNKVWVVALKDRFPRVARNLESLGMDPLMYTVSWFLCIWTNIEIPSVLRLHIFERYLAFGNRSLISMGLTLVQMNKADLERCSIERAIAIFQRPGELPGISDWRGTLATLKRNWVSEPKYAAYFRAAGVEFFV